MARVAADGKGMLFNRASAPWNALDDDALRKAAEIEVSSSSRWLSVMVAFFAVNLVYYSRHRGENGVMYRFMTL